ncbi:MAG TPA: metallophosphoesterase [Candidatus Alistipes intestinipullorum]|nr:metallophosphoesterase [Candidatus Alistipes intestinipullorum]
MKHLLLGAAMLFLTGAAAQDFRITHGPYLCDMTDDGVTVVWTTSAPALSWIEAAPADGRSFYAEEHPRHYETVAGRRQAHKTLHTVRLEGLKPGTDYCYRIFSQEVREWSHNDKVSYGAVAASDVYGREPYTFRTFPAEGSRCDFIVLNDIHGRDAYMTDLCKGLDFRELGFVAFNGDMASSIESEQQLFDDFLDASVELFATETPILYNRGNHETRGVYADRLGSYFPTGSGNFYTLRRYGDICLLTLDCGEDKPDNDIEYCGLADYDAYRAEECEWLKQAVESEAFLGASTRIVLLHVPPTLGTWHGNLQLKELFLPVLNEAGIDLMLCGHEHSYAYLPAGEGGAEFPILVNDNRSYVRCTVSAEKITLQVIGPEGAVSHTHEIEPKHNL